MQGEGNATTGAEVGFPSSLRRFAENANNGTQDGVVGTTNGTDTLNVTFGPGVMIDAPHTGAFVQEVSYYRPDLVPLGSRP